MISIVEEVNTKKEMRRANSHLCLKHKPAIENSQGNH